MEINKFTKLKDIISFDPNTAKVFMKNNIHCLSCSFTSNETLDSISKIHKVDIDNLIAEIRNTINKTEEK